MTESGESSPVPFRELFEISPDAILVFWNGVVTHANPAAVRLLHASALTDLVGKHSRELLHPDSHAQVEKNVRAIQGGAPSTRSEERYVRLDGEPVDVEVTAAPATFLPGRSFVVVLRDIRDRKEAESRRQREMEAASEAALAKERARWLREVIDVLPNMVFARDEHGVFILANRRYAELLGLPAESVLGKTLADLGSEHARTVAEEDASVLATGEPMQIAERMHVDAAGQKRLFEETRVPLLLGSAKRPAVLGVMTDLTERKRLESRVARARHLEGIGRLAGGIAHDFNNILGVILAFSQVVAETLEPNDERLEDLREIGRAAGRGADLAKQLLLFARRQAGTPRLFDLTTMLRANKKLLASVLGQDVALHLDLATGCVINADPQQIEQVMISLTENARDAMPAGGKLHVRTTIEQYDEGLAAQRDVTPGPHVVMSFSDSGRGISSEAKERLFEPFFTTKDMGKGTGLSLATCYGIVRHAGGAIWAEGEPGAGSAFFVALPHFPSDALDQSAPISASAPPKDGNGELVLVVEDHDQLRTVTARALARRGYEVIQASNGPSALELAASSPKPIQLLLTDVLMPKMRGPEVAAAMRSLYPGIKVLFMSGYTGELASESLAEAALPLLAKPFTGEVLAKMVRDVLDS